MFDHWKIHNRLLELGWKKYEIPYFKRGLADSIQGQWNSKILEYTHDFENWYHEDYSDPKMKPAPDNYRLLAYEAGYLAGEDFIKEWAKTLNITWDSISGESEMDE